MKTTLLILFLALILFCSLTAVSQIGPGPMRWLQAAAVPKITSSLWTPTTASMGLYEWLDASTVSGSDSAPINGWKTSYGSYATNASGNSTLYPLLRTGANGLGGINIIQASTGGQSLSSGTTFALSQPYTIGLIFKFASTSGTQVIFADNSSAVNLSVSSGNFVFYGGGANQTIATADTSWHTLVINCNGAAGYYSLDGGAKTTWASSPGTSGMTSFFLYEFESATDESTSEIGDFLAWAGTLNSSDITGFSTWAKNKYGITFPH